VDLAGRALLVADRPYVALAGILARFHPPRPIEPGISDDARVDDRARVGDPVEIGPFAVIEGGAVLGDRVRIGAGCHVGRDTEIGDDTVLHPGVTVYAGTRVGRRCILHAGVVLGADGFGFAHDGREHRKVPQVGRVVVEDDVEIGANSAVDRGALEDTVIGAGSKIDDLVMVAHGVRIGRGCLLVAQAGVAGSSVLGDFVTVAGQSGVAGHLDVGDRVVVAAKSAVFADVEAGAFVAGVPAVDHRVWKRSQAVQKRLPELRGELGRLRERVAALEAAIGSDPPEEG
jgi:UDP-3-O-[3-hydroxymyristoyl] glucosamine N-acyltransferase